MEGIKVTPFLQDVKGINEMLIACALKINRSKYRLYRKYMLSSGNIEVENKEFMNLFEECVWRVEEKGI